MKIRLRQKGLLLKINNIYFNYILEGKKHLGSCLNDVLFCGHYAVKIIKFDLLSASVDEDFVVDSIRDVINFALKT